MGLIEIASGNSVWRGMDYYENHKVVSWNKSGNSTYEGVVSGSNGDMLLVPPKEKFLFQCRMNQKMQSI